MATTNGEGETEYTPISVRVDNEYGLIAGANLPNHTSSMRGRGKFVMATENTRAMQFRTRQEVYRFVAHLLYLTETTSLPDEDGEHELSIVQNAVESSLAE